MFRPVLLLTLPVALFGLASCGSDDSDSEADVVPAASEATDAPASTEPAPAVPSEPVVVQALDNTFRPQDVTIVAGTEVRWENVGRNDHDVQPVEGEDWGVEVEDFAPGDDYSHVFETAGTYEYVCTIHGVPGTGMIGTIIVTG
jgi:plastocyanin